MNFSSYRVRITFRNGFTDTELTLSGTEFKRVTGVVPRGPTPPQSLPDGPLRLSDFQGDEIKSFA